MLPVIYFYLIAISYCILWVILCSQPKRKELLMMNSRSIPVPSGNNHYSIYVQWLDTSTNIISFSLDIPGMPKDAAERTEMFAAGLDHFTEGDGSGRLLVSVTDTNPKESVFSRVIHNLPDSERERAWNFFIRLKDHY